MTEQNAISSAKSGELQRSSELTSKDKTSAEKQVKEQCGDCLKTSVEKKDGVQQINKNQAIEKLDLVKQTTNSEDLKNKIDTLIKQLEQINQKELTTNQQIKAFIESAFSQNTPDKQIQNAAIQASIITEDSKNPFKAANPFAPQIITAVKKNDAVEISPKKPLEQKHSAESPEEETTFWQKLSGLFTGGR